MNHFSTCAILASFFVGLTTAIQAQTPSYVPTDGLVAWWDMTPSNLDQENAVNLTGVHVPNRLGQPDAALQFSQTGSCYQACGGVRFAVSESVNEEFTFAFWVKPERSVTQRPESSACSPSVTVPMANSNQNWALYPDIGGPAGYPEGYGVGLSVGTNGVFVAEHTGNLLVSRMSYPAEIDDFIHVVVSYANDSSKLYVDGELVRQRAQSCTSGIQHLTWVRPDQDSTEVRIATGLYSPTFIGVIDDYGYWNRALTEGEIDALYASLSVPGCTDSEACNYDWEAIDDDGSCVHAIVGEDCFEGASICGENTWWHPGLQQCLSVPCLTCPADLNSDALVTIADMLQLLASFGDACTYAGCTDESACNFAPVATVDDGSCVYGGINDCGCVYDCSGGVIGDADGDGVCDDSPVVSCGDSLACNYDAGACLFNDSLCVFGVEVPGAPCDDANPNTFNDVWNATGCQCEGVAYISSDGNGPCAGQNTLTFDNHTYQLVEIGTQCWFAEELQTTHYTNGDAIPRGLSNDEWSNANFGATGVYGENLDGCSDWFTPGYDACDSVASLENFGRPYNFFAVMDPRGLCPTGWAVATDSAWMVMEAFLGIPESELETFAWRGTTQGTALKSTNLWYAGNNGTNEFGFNATPGGYRHNAYGAYVDAGLNGNYWTGTPHSSTQGVLRMFYYNEARIHRAAHQNQMGRYVRCVQDGDASSCFDPDGDGVCAADEVTGCTDEGACNYSAEFTESDPASCIFPTVDECGCALDCDGNLLNDLDGDGVCDDGTFEGCNDTTACNYDPAIAECANVNEFCIYGTEEPGTPCDDGNADTFNDVWNETGCACVGTAFVAEDGSGPCAGASLVDFNGQSYNLVEIGSQCWFRENLATKHFTNGDTIPTLSDGAYSHGLLAALSAEGPAVIGYVYDEANFSEFGGMYNLSAVTDDRGVCPNGWEVPADSDWKILEAELGMSETELGLSELRGASAAVGNQLRISSFFSGDNTSGFSAMAGGVFGYSGYFYKLNEEGNFWSSTQWGGMGWKRRLGAQSGVFRELGDSRNGMSVRCLKSDSNQVNVPGAECDDADASTYNDSWDETGTSCEGMASVALDGSGPCEGQVTINYQGDDYPLIELGDQCWFRENLRVMNFSNGDSIPTLAANTYTHGLANALASAGPAVLSWINNESNYAYFGGLYNHAAVQDDRGLCPSGWLVPSDSEWKALEAWSGMDASELSATQWRGGSQQVGRHLRSIDFSNGWNSGGFSARAGGNFSLNGYMYEIGNDGWFWTSTVLGGMAWSRSLGSHPGVKRALADDRSGLSVRCLKASSVEVAEPGAPCDDGDANTYNDVWDENGANCTGIAAVSSDGSGACGDDETIHFQGHDYALVEIGDQCWFRENLKTKHFANGDSIPTLSMNMYNHGEVIAISSSGPVVLSWLNNESNYEYFGGLYNLAAVQDERGLCPAGWEIPADLAWKSLETELGMQEVELDRLNQRGVAEDIGKQMRQADFLWGSNTSGFSALGGGSFSINGQMYDIGEKGLFWSSTQWGSNAWGRTLTAGNGIFRTLFAERGGASVRCVKYSNPANSPGTPCNDGNVNTFNDTWDESGACVGVEAVLEDGTGACNGEVTVTYNGHVYGLIELGDQCWFRENLQSKHFSNGDSIPTIASYNHGALGSLTNAGPVVASWYNSEGNYEYFGGLYNLNAVLDDRGLCPVGWGVPTDEDWMSLESWLGMAPEELEGTQIRGVSSAVGEQMRSIDFIAGSNTSGFSARGAGYFSLNGYMHDLGEMAGFWSSSSADSMGWSRGLGVSAGISRNLTDVRTGFSVRCLMAP